MPLAQRVFEAKLVELAGAAEAVEIEMRHRQRGVVVGLHAA